MNMRETRNEILNAIEAGITPENIHELYQILYDREIFSREDFDKDFGWFKDLILAHTGDFAAQGAMTKNIFVKKMWIDKYIHMSPALNWIFSSPKVAFQNQIFFADTIENMIGDAKVNILEIGCGAIPYVSMTLAERYGYVSAMDEALRRGVQHEVLNRLCVDSSEINFNNETPLENVDVVIGQKPCPNIEMIVDRCVSEGKPYILEVCHCGEPEDGWKKYLAGKYGSKILDEDDMIGCMDIVYDLG